MKKPIVIILILSSLLLLTSCDIRTAKYDFELEGDVILKEGYRGEYLIATITCITSCVSGRDYYLNHRGLFYTSAELITPDGTIYKFTPETTQAETQVDVKRGDVFKEYLVFGNLPLNCSYETCDIRVWSTTNGKSEKIFENVTIRFEAQDAKTQ